MRHLPPPLSVRQVSTRTLTSLEGERKEDKKQKTKKTLGTGMFTYTLNLSMHTQLQGRSHTEHKDKRRICMGTCFFGHRWGACVFGRLRGAT